MKKIVCLLICAWVVFALAGCGERNARPDDGADTLEMSERSNWLDSVVEEKHPDAVKGHAAVIAEAKRLRNEAGLSAADVTLCLPNILVKPHKNYIVLKLQTDVEKEFFGLEFSNVKPIKSSVTGLRYVGFQAGAAYMPGVEAWEFELYMSMMESVGKDKMPEASSDDAEVYNYNTDDGLFLIEIEVHDGFGKFGLFGYSKKNAAIFGAGEGIVYVTDESGQALADKIYEDFRYVPVTD